MKVNWFHLMPYPYLPEDFKQKYRSVWVDVPSELYDPEKGHVVYNDYLDELEFAAEVGFDGACYRVSLSDDGKKVIWYGSKSGKKLHTTTLFPGDKTQ